jgi:uncharacterized membrane protein YfcA
MMSPDLETLLFLGFIGLVTGFIKGGLPSLGPLLSALVALYFVPAQALGITLCFLLLGDLAAVTIYWRQAKYGELRGMLLPVLIGIMLGALVLAHLKRDHFGPMLGVLILVLVAMEPLRPALTRLSLAYPGTARLISGIVAGLATTLGNAAGPVLAIYFLVLKMDKTAFVSTSAIFFFFVNVMKIPVFVSQNILNIEFLPSIGLCAPLIFMGAYAGKRFLNWIPQFWFNRVVLILTALAGLLLLRG